MRQNKHSHSNNLKGVFHIKLLIRHIAAICRVKVTKYGDKDQSTRLGAVIKTGRMSHRKKTSVLLKLKTWRKLCLQEGLYRNFSKHSPTRSHTQPTFTQHTFLMVSHVPTAAGLGIMHSTSKDGQICCDAGDEWPGPGRRNHRTLPRHPAFVHVRVYLQCHCSSWYPG